MLKYADVQMDLLKPACRPDGFSVDGIVLPYHDCERKISKQVR